MMTHHFVRASHRAVSIRIYFLLAVYVILPHLRLRNDFRLFIWKLIKEEIRSLLLARSVLVLPLATGDINVCCCNYTIKHPTFTG